MPEITDLPLAEVQSDLNSLNAALDATIPKEQTGSNLLIATWNLRAFASASARRTSGAAGCAPPHPGDVWMAWQVDAREKGEGMVQVFRREHSAYEEARFPLHALDASRRYAVMSLEEPGRQQELAGRELLESGLPVLLKEKPAAAIFIYKRAMAKP